MSDPLISVVVPTSGKRDTLALAVASCLECSDEAPIEVIVVPNGDGPWRSSLGSLGEDDRVHVHPIRSANANAARNFGMSIARGTFLRFLDDDDLLYPSGAKAQVDLLRQTRADVCSGAIDLLRDDGMSFGAARQPATPDFPTGVLCSKRMVQVTAHLFRSAALDRSTWNESLDYSQDIDWFMTLCAHNELLWVKTGHTVGGWRRHTGNRTSTIAPLNSRKKIVANAVISLTESLRQQGRLTQSRRLAAADGLWECVHTAYFVEPAYWQRIATIAAKLAPGSRPDIPVQRLKAWSLLGISPILVETAIAPKRLAGYALRRALLRLGWLKSW